MKECVVVLGMHRSGTSVLTGLISLFGGFVGSDLMKPTADNPKGYFENNKIYVLNEKILRENNASWHDYSFVVEDIDKQDFQSYVLEAKSIIEDDLKYVKRTIIKDPRICILFPIWEQALNELNINIKLIFVYRSPIEVSHSLYKRDEMEVEKGLMLWSHYFLQSEFYSRKHERIIVEYNDDFSDLSLLLHNIGKFIGREVTEELLKIASDFYSPGLKHHQVALDNISDDLPSYLSNLIGILVKRELNKSKKIDNIRNEFYDSKKYYLYDQQRQEETIKQKEETIKEREKVIQEKEETIKEREKVIQEKEEIIKRKAEIFVELEESYHAFQKKYDDEHNVLLDVQKELRQEQKNIVDVVNDSAQREKQLSNLVELSKRQIKERQHQVDIMRSYFVSGDKLLQRLVRRKSSYKKLHKQVANVAKLKLRKRLLPFAKKKNKRLIREKLLIMDSELFSAFFYLSVNADVKQAGVDPLKHFCTKGWMEGRSPSMDFDVKSYLVNHPDVARAKINPLIHYITHGKKEGRKISPVMFYGKEFTSLEVIKKIPQKQLKVSNENNLIGPIFEKRWDESISNIVMLKQKAKLANKDIPSEVIEISKKQLTKHPLKISVVMPTWNRANSICKSIDSILSQSFLPAEIIISDDGSTDRTIELLHQNYQKEISTGLIKLVLNDHEGVSATRNSGLETTTGELIAYLDSDNVWREHYLLIMAAAFSENDELNCAYSALERHDNNHNKKNILAVDFDRKRLLDANFIDLNVFIHRRIIFDQYGGFDTHLKRLVDWELIIRYTKNYTPALIPFVGVDYILDDKNLKNITTTVSLDDNRERVHRGYFQERLRYGLESIHLAYILWDYPALSQTFVMEELKWLVGQGYDVIVYYAVEPDKSVTLDFEIASYKVEDADELAGLFKEHQRNFCHGHFAYPTVTKHLYPACVKVNIPFTFMPHAVDIFHHENKKRNKIGEITQHPLCLKVFVHGEFHKKFIEDCGVPSHKIAFNIQAVNTDDFTNKVELPLSASKDNSVFKGVLISRFVEKKGISSLIEAASLLEDEGVIFEVYGYGPLEDDYKKQIGDLGLKNVLLKGPLANQQSVAKAYQQSDFLIAPCVVANNGDIDGFPTVILEAMSMGLPVITTDVAAIPDYLTDGVEALVVPAGEIGQLADSVRRLKAMSSERKVAMIKRAQIFLNKKIGVSQTMQMLLDIWQSYTLDIFLVTYNTKKHEDRKETFEIIKRIFKYTTTPFTLTIVDNDSDEGFWSELCERVIDKPNVRLIRKNQNIFCGPASNIALELSDNEFAIYICSKEGFIKKHGWERSLLGHMRSNPNDVIAGHHSQMPSYIYGKEYESHPEFAKFRNPDFAKENPDRVFKHVQGGVFIMRRDFIKNHGGFNPATPHGGMDVEMSYYIESLGYDLGEIPEVASLTVKTRPTLTTIINERTAIAHPLTIQSVTSKLDSLVKDEGHRCNICDWKGKLFEVKKGKSEQVQVCPECSSTGFGRSVMKLMAGSIHIYRGEKCALLSSDKSLKRVLEKLFRQVLVSEKSDIFLKSLNKDKNHFNCIIIDPKLINDSAMTPIWQMMLAKLLPDGEIIFADVSFQDDPIVNDASNSKNKNIQRIFSERSNQYSIGYSDFSSYCIAYDWRRFGKLSQVRI